VTGASIDFGTALTGSGTVNWICTNFDSTAPVSFTLCAGVGTPSYPGTSARPQLISGGQTLDYNVYRDSSATDIWAADNPLTENVSIPAGATVSGGLTFYGRIPPGQPSPPGTYTGFIFNNPLGFVVGASPRCIINVPNLQGQDFTLNVTAVLVEACSIGTIGAIDFGQRSGFESQVDASGSVQLVCPLNVAWILSFDAGMNAASGVRRMRSASGDFIPYQLYRNTGRTDLIDIDSTISGTGTGTTQSTAVFGRAEIAAPPPVGQYSDVVVITLSF